MTSDAKVGLLLGLVFIFLIAFLINGLPSFKGHKGNNDLTVNSLGSKNNSLGIAENERKVSRQFIEQDIRLNAPLPQTSSVSKTSIEGRPAVGAVPASDESLVQSLREVAGKLESTVVENPAVRTIKTSAGHVLPLPKSYIVSEGDNLAIIAQKVYGPVEGKRKANIERIFKANTAILQSPDEIYVGQKLVIPDRCREGLNRSGITEIERRGGSFSPSWNETMIDFKKAKKAMYPVGRIAFVVTMALTVLFWAGLGQAQEEAPSLRVVNLDRLPGNISPDETGLAMLAGLDPSEHPRLFADCCDLNITMSNEVQCYEPDMVIGEDLSTLTVAMEEGTPLNFTTEHPEDGPKRCDAAVVDSAGIVTCLDRPVVIDYALRTVSFVDMPPLKPGDTLILFVEDASPFKGSRENTGKNYDCG